MKRIAILVVIATLFATTAIAQSASSFQGSCSNYSFTYSGNNAALQATCLTATGRPNDTLLVIRGISNQNGRLVAGGSGPSSFQQSCGSITVTANASGATLSALCRTSSGGIVSSSVALNGIGNNDGTLSY